MTQKMLPQIYDFSRGSHFSGKLWVTKPRKHTWMSIKFIYRILIWTIIKFTYNGLLMLKLSSSKTSTKYCQRKRISQFCNKSFL